MIPYKRYLYHIGFWIVYFSINVFTELYLSSSHESYPMPALLLEIGSSQLLLLCIKIPAVYYTLYSLIPRWLKNPSRFILYFEAAIMLISFLVGYRALIHLVIWPYVTHSNPGPITSLQFMARMFYSLFDLLQVIGITAAIKLFRLRIAAIKNEKNLVQEKLKSEMLQLKSQINPHFLFNTLNNIYSLARNQSPATPETVMKLSKILRYMLYETGKKTIPIDAELKIIDDYMELQQLRFGNRLQVKINKKVDEGAAQIAPLLIFPLIENAFKHGNGEAMSEIQFDVFLSENKLSVEIINPIGKSSMKVKDEEEGIGLPNLRRQLELLYRDHTFHYQEKDNRFFVNLQINLSSYAGFELFDSRG